LIFVSDGARTKANLLGVATALAVLLVPVVVACVALAEVLLLK